MLIKNILAAVSSAVLLSLAYIAANNASYDRNEVYGASEAAASTTTSTLQADSTATATSSASGTTTTTEPTTVKKYKITFLDFEGKTLQTLEIEEGSAIDYSLVDTSSLDKHLDSNTELAFSSWDMTPAVADKDYTLHSLSKTAKIYYTKKPDKYRYFSTNGKVILDGMQVYIDLSVQTPKKDKNGNYISEEKTIDISSSCVAKPVALSAAFAKSDNATISVYPLGDNKPIFSFDIICYRDLGDVNEDGMIDSVDASMVLNIYANIAASRTYKPTEKLKKLSDVNMDNKVDVLDASIILEYYAVASTAKSFMDWEDILDFDKILKQ